MNMQQIIAEVIQAGFTDIMVKARNPKGGDFLYSVHEGKGVLLHYIGMKKPNGKHPDLSELIPPNATSADVQLAINTIRTNSVRVLSPNLTQKKQNKTLNVFQAPSP